MTRSEIKKERAEMKRRFHRESDGLFDAAWREMLAHERANGALPDDLEAAMEQAMSERVNDSGSKFYMYG